MTGQGLFEEKNDEAKTFFQEENDGLTFSISYQKWEANTFFKDQNDGAKTFLIRKNKAQKQFHHAK